MAGVSKPQLRGLLQSHIQRTLIGAVTAAGLTAFLIKTFVGDARKKKYIEYYKNYDADAHFERMRKAGLLQSAGP